MVFAAPLIPWTVWVSVGGPLKRVLIVIAEIWCVAPKTIHPIAMVSVEARRVMTHATCVVGQIMARNAPLM